MTLGEVRQGREPVGAPALRYERVCKIFGATTALDDVTLDVWPGRIHAFVGENGAGKSTCVGLASGRLSATSGSVKIYGRELAQGSPRAAHRSGVAAIYQELTIIHSLSAQANVFLGQELSRAGVLSEQAMRRRYHELCQRLHIDAHPDVPAGSLSGAERQLLEIMRAVASEARIILFDEPTSFLADAERKTLFAFMDKLRSDGVAVVWVSHNLQEVLTYSDETSVFREGKVVAHALTREWSERALVHAMLGEDASRQVVSASSSKPRIERSLAPLLRASVCVPGSLEQVSLEARPGEIVGIAGLAGSGRADLLRALGGLTARASGHIDIDGRSFRLPRTPRQAYKLGIGLVPEDRKSSGLVLQTTATDNIVMSDLSRVSSLGVIRNRASYEQARAVGETVGLPASMLGKRVRELSGGNQQKLLVARWLHASHKILLADHPTRGVDIGARLSILRTLRLAVAEGKAIVMVSSDLDEILTISDQIVVIAAGRHVATFDNSEKRTDAKTVLHAMFDVELAA